MELFLEVDGLITECGGILLLHECIKNFPHPSFSDQQECSQVIINKLSHQVQHTVQVCAVINENETINILQIDKCDKVDGKSALEIAVFAGKISIVKQMLNIRMQEGRSMQYLISILKKMVKMDHNLDMIELLARYISDTSIIGKLFVFKLNFITHNETS